MVHDQTWVVWFRNGLNPRGKWYAWQDTAASTRSACIRDCLAGPYLGNRLRTMSDWRRLRSKGLVACRHTFLYAFLPE